MLVHELELFLSRHQHELNMFMKFLFLIKRAIAQSGTGIKASHKRSGGNED